MHIHRTGYTLVELMIALALGLIIVAAVLSIYLNSQRSLVLQSSLGELQENANFGMRLLAHDIRHANLNMGNAEQQINPLVLGSGIVLNQANLPKAFSEGPTAIANLGTLYLTRAATDSDNTSSGKSDQLTIQYRPSVTTVYDCEGQKIESASTATILQRYFLDKIDTPAGEPPSYALRCDAAIYKTGSTTIEGLGKGAEQLLTRIEAFRVRFGIKNPDGTLRYASIAQYQALSDAIVNNPANQCSTAPDSCLAKLPNIISVELSVLARSQGRIGANAANNPVSSFQLAGTDVTLKGNAQTHQNYLHQVVTQVVALRNGAGTT